MDVTLPIPNEETLQSLAENMGRLLKGGEVLELVGDVGAGKTTFVKALARGLEIDEVVQSPTFTISRLYQARNDLELHHYDFYRLQEPGVLRASLAESLVQQNAITALEWDDSVRDILPLERTITITLKYVGNDAGARELHIHAVEDQALLLQSILAERKHLA